MSSTIHIQVTEIGSTAGPFDIYYNSISPTNLLLSGITPAELIAGLDVENVPDIASTVLLFDTGVCNDIFTYPVLQPTPQPTPSKTATPNPTPSPTSTGPVTPTPFPTSTTTPTPSPTRTPISTQTPSQTATQPLTPTPTSTNPGTSTPTPTPSPTSTQTPTQTPSPTQTSTQTPTPSITFTSTKTPTPTPTNTPVYIYRIYSANSRTGGLGSGEVMFSINAGPYLQSDIPVDTTVYTLVQTDTCALGDTITVYAADYSRGDIRIQACYLANPLDTCIYDCTYRSYTVTQPVTNIYVNFLVTQISTYYDFQFCYGGGVP